ncbi:uncharacterized protein VSU04_013757 isoform 2-T2 [Chlamydotis macqueenii]
MGRGTVTESASTPLPTATPGTAVTSPSKTYHKSSPRELHLLPVVLPALVLLIFIAITILALTKIRLQKETERRSMGDLEAAPIRADVTPVKEQMMEETLSAEKMQECRTDSSKRRIIHAILGRFGMTNLSQPHEEKSTFQQD